jgi:hypothetical protein
MKYSSWDIYLIKDKKQTKQTTTKQVKKSTLKLKNNPSPNQLELL